ncbi:glycoside hydrolase family 3 C-terminal domain-containing protein [Actinomadura barringtoniae]|uniref:Glycoside hydrolase family 3 C-terminal domain-containing protein n=1 Tax=Actinomadura barringtoniae TaxID=1427535 RepID=A0A939T211_9ACTN|nr:glycoside hydrolase family 3 C-terminal domain-containing protein [Actinomadura barringtoniae]MBO2448686.1 glycoside hydrolase family 3 C-terminal domain-containing protein [Actinomadura barringtoniae]
MIDRLLSSLDLDTKLRLITGTGLWSTAEAPVIGLRAMHLSDGPVGVRGWSENERNTSANLPSPTALAASWDDDLLRRVGELLAAEAATKEVDVVLGPTINLHRAPRGGRHFECFSEDPLLTGRLAAAYVDGIQRHGIAACPKHFVANDSETDRNTVDARVDERTLRELYLAPFEHVVRESRPWSIMAAYNGVNGAPMTENALLEDPLRSEWGFDGVVVSDWGAVYSTEKSARAGTDLAMPGPEPLWCEALAEAVRSGTVPEEAIDRKVRHLLLLAERVGALKDFPADRPRPTADPAAALAREATAAGMVLLRNESDLLPLATDMTVALIGPGSRDPRTQGGGSAAVTAPYIVTPEQGMQAVWGERLVQADGLRLHSGLRRPSEGDIVSGAVIWLAPDGSALLTEPTNVPGVFRSKATTPPGSTSCILRATFRASESGTWQVGGFGVGDLELRLNDGPVVAEHTVTDPWTLVSLFFDPPQASTSIELQAGEEVTVIVHYTWPPELPMFRARLGLRRPELPAEEEFTRAVEAARTADVAVVVIGTTEAIESEGFDRTDLALPGRQNELVAAVAEANPRTVVVVNSGAPVEMPWRDDVAAVLLGWFPGMEFGNALADVLSGAVEPGGRLPTTWPADADSVPVDDVTPSDGTLAYTEGLHIGHRAYLRDGATPAYWFGEGVGYTNWDHEEFTVDGTTAHISVCNTGNRPGKHVVQLYLSRPDSAIERPARWLAGYATVHAEPGECVDVTIPIAARAFQHWNGHVWATEPGPFTLHLASSAGNTLADLPIQP